MVSTPLLEVRRGAYFAALFLKMASSTKNRGCATIYLIHFNKSDTPFKLFNKFGNKKCFCIFMKLLHINFVLSISSSFLLRSSEFFIGAKLLRFTANYCIELWSGCR